MRMKARRFKGLQLDVGAEAAAEARLATLQARIATLEAREAELLADLTTLHVAIEAMGAHVRRHVEEA